LAVLRLIQNVDVLLSPKTLARDVDTSTNA